MATLKVIEVMGNSSKSWEDAAQQVIADASRSIKNIRSVWIKDMEAKVNNNSITEFRINAKVSFEVEPNGTA